MLLVLVMISMSCTKEVISPKPMEYKYSKIVFYSGGIAKDSSKIITTY